MIINDHFQYVFHISNIIKYIHGQPKQVDPDQSNLTSEELAFAYIIDYFIIYVVKPSPGS